MEAEKERNVPIREWLRQVGLFNASIVAIVIERILLPFMRPICERTFSCLPGEWKEILHQSNPAQPVILLDLERVLTLPNPARPGKNYTTEDLLTNVPITELATLRHFWHTTPPCVV